MDIYSDIYEPVNRTSMFFRLLVLSIVVIYFGVDKDTVDLIAESTTYGVVVSVSTD